MGDKPAPANMRLCYIQSCDIEIIYNLAKFIGCIKRDNNNNNKNNNNSNNNNNNKNQKYQLGSEGKFVCSRSIQGGLSTSRI